MADPKDPFGMDDKNLRRVLTQILYSINVERQKMIGRWIALGVCVVGIPLGWHLGGILLFVSIGMVLGAPFIIMGYFADRDRMKKQQARLAECERRISVERTGPVPGQ